MSWMTSRVSASIAIGPRGLSHDIPFTAPMKLSPSVLPLSTLTVQVDGGQKTIRPAYNRIHSFYIFKKKRLGYPRSEPYATGKWSDYRRWLDSLVTFSTDQLQQIRDQTV